VIYSDECSVEHEPAGQQRCTPGRERWHVDCVASGEGSEVHYSSPGNGSVNARDYYRDLLRRRTYGQPDTAKVILSFLNVTLFSSSPLT